MWKCYKTLQSTVNHSEIPRQPGLGVAIWSYRWGRKPCDTEHLLYELLSLSSSRYSTTKLNCSTLSSCLRIACQCACEGEPTNYNKVSNRPESLQDKGKRSNKSNPKISTILKKWLLKFFLQRKQNLIRIICRNCMAWRVIEN